MARPTTKDALLAAAAAEYSAFQTALSRFDAGFLTDIAFQADIADQSRNPRDVICHIHAWQLMACEWCRIGDDGGVPHVPGPGLTWRHTPTLNAAIWQRYAATGYDDAVGLLVQSHADTVELIAAHTNEQLFNKGVYPWTKTTTLGAYFVSSTSSHYVWGIKTIKLIATSLT